MLPGLWQVLVSLGVFASVRLLPAVARRRFLLAATVLMLASQNHTFAWTMGLPFAMANR
jgi:hypothetical protein